jgi:hypothetical protein
MSNFLGGKSDIIRILFIFKAYPNTPKNNQVGSYESGGDLDIMG